MLQGMKLDTCLCSVERSMGCPPLLSTARLSPTLATKILSRRRSTTVAVAPEIWSSFSGSSATSESHSLPLESDREGACSRPKHPMIGSSLEKHSTRTPDYSVIKQGQMRFYILLRRVREPFRVQGEDFCMTLHNKYPF